MGGARRLIGAGADYSRTMRWAAVLVMALLAACGSGGADSPSPGPTPSPPPAELLPGEQWVLLSAQADPATPTFEVTLTFDAEGVAGKAPVNTYFGPAQIGAGTMRLGPLASTEMAGPPDAMRAETEFLQAMSAVTSWTVGDDLLALASDTGPLLTFAAPGSTGAFAVTVLGEPRAAAKAAVIAAGYEFRVISADGEQRAVTLDYRPDRINAAIVDGVVTEVSVG